MRLVDLHCNWATQYATETSQYDPALYADIPGRVGQVAGYLSSVSAAVLPCGRRPEDWSRQTSPWDALGEMLARYEAEFAGRLLQRPVDAARWLAEIEETMCWGVLAIEGLDFLIREPNDLDRLEGLFARGVRVFQFVESGASLLAGADIPGEDRGLTDLGRATLERLAGLGRGDPGSGPLPSLDIADLGGRSTSEVLSWYESDPSRAGKLLLARTHGGIRTASDGPGLRRDQLSRFRVLGGILGLSVGPPHVDSTEALRMAIETAAAMPLAGNPGYEGIAIGTDFLQLEHTLGPLGDASRVVEWVTSTFPFPAAESIVERTGRVLFLRLSGAASAIPGPTPSS